MTGNSSVDSSIYYLRQQTIHSHSVILLLTDTEWSIFTDWVESERGREGRKRERQMGTERGTERVRGEWQRGDWDSEGQSQCVWKEAGREDESMQSRNIIALVSITSSCVLLTQVLSTGWHRWWDTTLLLPEQAGSYSGFITRSLFRY